MRFNFEVVRGSGVRTIVARSVSLLELFKTHHFGRIRSLFMVVLVIARRDTFVFRGWFVDGGEVGVDGVFDW